MAAFIVVALHAGMPAAHAQQSASQKPSVRIATRVLIEADVESPLTIQITPPESIPPKSYVQLRGLPATAVLNEGHSISPGVWAIPLAALPSLSIRVPKEVTGTSAVSARLVSLEGSVLAEARTTVVVAASYVLGEKRASAEPAPRAVRQPPPSGPPSGLTGGVAPVPPAPAPAPAIASLPPATQPLPAPRPVSPPVAVPPRPSDRVPQAPPPAPASRLSPQERASAEKMVEAGNRHLGNGNIAAARGFYRRAAEAGHAEGAVKLGTTFDPVELAAMGAQGIDASPAEARKWYELARQLGAGGIDARLSRLGAP